MITTESFLMRGDEKWMEIVDKVKINIKLMFMKTISMVDFRLKTEEAIAELRRGESLLLTYRGKPLANIVPVEDTRKVQVDDSFYRFYEKAESGLPAMSNEEIDKVIYAGQ
ncbi:MAG: type II toxin-antitoxin system prevent-host-death family antitoxin [Verrucomicrobiae bacterium]|nr:type II toxin-antitoxin system prevent-host-death family antitoxin [Verrucomicrobiae bacterium]